MPDEEKPSTHPTDDASATPERRRPALVVGLGASAGGLEALGEFFENLPGDTGFAFVVVTHQHPGRPSLMPELLARRAAMPVTELERDTPAESDHIYLTRPGANLSIYHGTLHPIGETAPPQHPIDYFFRALAQDQRERAVGIVLSGTGTDGTLGLEEIKGASGMTMVQTEASARYAGMPHSAIMALQVDYVLPAAELPAALIAYARGVVHRTEVPAVPPEGEARPGLERIFAILRNRTGHDFSGYKRATLRRRIERRMNVHQVETVADYVEFLQRAPKEADRLFKELLIGVTSFFRDPEAFDALEETLVPLVDSKPDGYIFRAWIPGCGTGEEAYSIAILLREIIERTDRRVGLQIFATDIDADAINVARSGTYPDSIAADVSPERLKKYFIQQDGFFRIDRVTREMVVFAPHNVIADPPFTKLDLLSCRNLLIYLENWVQQRLLPLFHYTLKPDGILFLGSSESVGGFTSLFGAVDKRWKIFRRMEVEEQPHAAELPTAIAPGHVRPQAAVLPQQAQGPPPAMTHVVERSLLYHLVPPTVLMHERGEIVHIHGRTGLFLEPAPGPQTQPANIFNMARQGLQLELAVAMRRAATAEGPVVREGVQVRTNGEFVSVDIRAECLKSPESLRGLYLVTFERMRHIGPQPETPSPADGEAEENARLQQMETEVQHIKEVHQSTVEELETANEELKSTNEELQSTNEELQSANEELETSKEEMQSLNEEMQTVNAELEGKIEELSNANDDMKNLLEGTSIATVFLDRDLNIKRFTEEARDIIRVLPGDIGRPVGDIVSRLRDHRLVQEAQKVMHTLIPVERELQSERGGWYLMRMLPYRTTENVIDGLVITFTDISKLKALQQESERILDTLGTSPTAVFGQDEELRYDWVCGSIFGRQADDVVGKTDTELFSRDDAKRLLALKKEVIERGTPRRDRIPLTVNGQPRTYEFFLDPRRDSAGRVVGLHGVVTEMDAEMDAEMIARETST